MKKIEKRLKKLKKEILNLNLLTFVSGFAFGTFFVVVILT